MRGAYPVRARACRGWGPWGASIRRRRCKASDDVRRCHTYSGGKHHSRCADPAGNVTVGAPIRAERVGRRGHEGSEGEAHPHSKRGAWGCEKG